jgi:phosphate starvation-inducible PhoH-like protein
VLTPGGGDRHNQARRVTEEKREEGVESNVKDLTEEVIELRQEEILDFCGRNDEKIREIEERFQTKIIPRGNKIRVYGPREDVDRTVGLIEDLLAVSRGEGRQLTAHQIGHVAETVRRGDSPTASQILDAAIPTGIRHRQISPMTAGQKRYVEAMRRSDIVFSIGPAGTGKTYLAMAMAVQSLIRGVVRRIILVRPAVDAGEKLGFLPGDIAAKVDPYLRPLYDALYEMMEAERIRAHIENGVIEVAPLAFMRGRTLNNAFAILDEGQNTTGEQMKMFLTRLGFDSRAVITGDVTQIDLAGDRESGLVHVQHLLKDIAGIEFVHLTRQDVVRHELVQKIIEAYERESAAKAEAAKAAGPP